MYAYYFAISLKAFGTNIAGTNHTLSQVFDFIKDYNGNFNLKYASKVVNEDVTPKVVYNGI